MHLSLLRYPTPTNRISHPSNICTPMARLRKKLFLWLVLLGHFTISPEKLYHGLTTRDLPCDFWDGRHWFWDCLFLLAWAGPCPARRHNPTRRPRSKGGPRARAGVRGARPTRSALSMP